MANQSQYQYVNLEELKKELTDLSDLLEQTILAMSKVMKRAELPWYEWVPDGDEGAILNKISEDDHDRGTYGV